MTPYNIHFEQECHTTLGPFIQPLTKQGQIHLFLQNYVGMYDRQCECVQIKQNLSRINNNLMI
jgi:hypothetical protein